MNRLLLIAHDFPPMAGGGVMRWTALCRYLAPRLSSIQVVAAEPFREPLDPALLAQLPASVHVSRIRDRYPHRAKDALTLKRAPQQANGAATPAPAPPASPSSLRRAYLEVRNNLNIPDDFLGWALAAARRARHLAPRPDAVITSGPPHAGHVAGLRSHRALCIPWVMEYRDAWAHNPLYRRSWAWAHQLNRRLEALCLSRCTHVVVDTPEKKEELLSWFGLPDSRVSVIRNGFDPADFQDQPGRSSTCFELIYTGNVGERRTTRYLVEAVRRLGEEDPEFAEHFRFRLCGKATAEDRALLHQLGDALLDEGYVPHTRAMRLLQQAHAAWLVEFPRGGGASLAPGKTYTYIGARTPVLATIHPCSAATVIREGGYGIVTPPDNPEAIGAALRELWREWKETNGRMHPRPDPSPFSRVQQAEAYYRLLSGLAGGEAPPEQAPAGQAT